MKKILELRSSVISLKVATIVNKFFNGDPKCDELLMSAYCGHEIIDESLYNHIESGLSPDMINPDLIKGTNYREMVYGLFIEIGHRLHDLLDLTERVTSAKFLSKNGETYTYEVTVEKIKL